MILYRSLTDTQYQDFMQGKDIIAKDPSADDVTMSMHLSRTLKRTPWISTTKTLFMLFAERKGGRHESAIIKIDTDIAEKKGAVFYDISTTEKLLEHGIIWRVPQNLAKKSREVLFFGSIPHEACTLLIDKASMISAYAEKVLPSISSLSLQYMFPDLKEKENVLFLREQIDQYGDSSDPLPVEQVLEIREIVSLLTSRTLQKQTKWFSINYK